MEDNFPVGLRVLVVDDNPTSLKIIEKMMIKCNYQVTTSTSARDALSILHHNLKKKKSIFDLVVSEVHLPDMDGFKLLEQIRLDTDVPVIMMSFEYEMSDVLKGIKHGACDYLIKPIPLEGVKTMWQHVVRKRWNHRKKLEKLRIFDNGISQDAPLPSVASLCSVNEDTWRSSNKSKEDEVEVEEKDDTITGKRRRVVWSAELHQKFVSVVEQLGVEKAVPKKILQLMDTPGITRENVASHLQKYRLYLRRANGGGSTPQNQVGLYVNSSHEGSARKTSPVEALDITLLDQLLVQSTPQMQPVGVLSNNSALITDQNDPFKHNTNTFHGFSGTAIDPVQLAYLKHQQEVQNVRKMSPQPYILSSNGSAIFNSNMGAVYNSMVPVQFPQPKPSPVYNHAMATQLVQLPLTSNGFLLNAATLLPGMLQDEGSLDTAASQIPTANTVSKKNGV